MTAHEKKECEKLVSEAMSNIDTSNAEWKKYERYKKENNVVDAEVAMRNADVHRGYAEGIYQALVCIGFKSDDMKEISDML